MVGLTPIEIKPFSVRQPYGNNYKKLKEAEFYIF